MSEDSIPTGPFTEKHPMHRPCGSQENHVPHTDREVQDGWGGKRYMWYACPGWETTHTVTVAAADGTVIGIRAVDLRYLDKKDRYLGANSAELNIVYEARQVGRELAPGELIFGAATYAVAPEVCPYDCDRCHEHLYPLQRELEDEGAED